MSNTLIQPYLLFGGRCEEALEFYRTAIGAEVEMLMRYKDSPEPTPPGMLAEGFENKVSTPASVSAKRRSWHRMVVALRTGILTAFRFRLLCQAKPMRTEFSQRFRKAAP